MLRFAWVLMGVACAGTPDIDTAAPVLESCELAEASQTCPSCSDGPLTCEFEGVSVTANSCGECQARGTLYQQLCDDGELATADEIEAGTTCSE